MGALCRQACSSHCLALCSDYEIFNFRRQSLVPPMGKVSCGSNKGKWSYFYADRPTSRLEQKSLTTFFKKTCFRNDPLVAGYTLSWSDRGTSVTSGSRLLRWTGSERSASTAPSRTQSCRFLASRTLITADHHARMMCTSPPIITYV